MKSNREPERKQELKLWNQFQKLRLSTKCGHFRIVESCSHCLEIQEQWYGRLKKKGFDDIEDRHLRILKKWTGSTDLFDVIKTQEPGQDIQSSWPETNFQKEAEILHSLEFRGICEAIGKHGNNALTIDQLMEAWELHCNGASSRKIAGIYKISAFSGWNIINKIKEMANLMDLGESKRIVTRDYESSTDAPFVFATWRNCLWYDTHTSEDPPNPTFYRVVTRKINLLLREPPTEVRIACLADDSNQMVGFAALSYSTLEFVYVKLDYRNQGIATLLTKGFTNIASPETKIGKSIADKKKLRIKGELDAEREDKYADPLCEISQRGTSSQR